MFVYKSNRLEHLVDALAEVLASEATRDPVNITRAEPIVVQSSGMATWLKMELARRWGIWAYTEFPFPKRMIDQLTGAKFVADPNQENLTWRLMMAMDTLSADFEHLQRYWRHGDSEWRVFQLCRRLADTFNQYHVYRPDLLRAWETGDDPDWQARLWRQLIADGFAPESLEPGRPEAWPSRLCLFGISSLPPSYVAICDTVSDRIPVHLFQFSPTRVYWANLLEPASAEVDAGHPLLQAMGGLARDFQYVLEQFDYQEVDRDRFHVNPDTSLLALIQNDILDFRSRQPEDRVSLEPQDRSIAFHSCHSPMREVEVLQDQLLHAFDRMDLRPADVAVMVPDIEQYAPLIDAVFGLDSRDKRYIPYAIADRSPRNQFALIDTLFRLFEVAPGRWSASEIMSLLATEPIRKRMEIEEAEMDQLALWVGESGIRWGLDAAHRKRHGQPAVPHNTWRFGLDRMALGYCMPTDHFELQYDCLPYTSIEGMAGRLLGRFSHACEVLFDCLQALNRSQTLAQWRDGLDGLINQLFPQTTREAWQLHAIRSAMDGLVANMPDACSDRLVPPQVVAEILDRRLRADFPGQAFMRGGVTFCALLPMRSIPFPMVCMLGLSDDVFPRVTYHAPFDRMTDDYRPGDRDRRLDDRYLFLEAILAARKYLYISYVGRGAQDQSEKPPSVVVSELMDLIDASVVATREPPHETLLTQHHLQAFNAAYFDPSNNLFSYSEHQLRGAESLRQPRHPRVFLDRRLPAVDPALRHQLAMEELIGFYASPCESMLRKRLGLHFGRRSRDLEDREPMELKSLARFQVADHMLELGLLGNSVGWDVWQGTGMFPLGRAGLVYFQDLFEKVKRLAQRSGLQDVAAPQREFIYVDLPNGTRLHAHLDTGDSGRISCRVGRIRAKDIIQQWIRHLILSVRLGQVESHLIGQNWDEVTEWRLSPVSQPIKWLNELVDRFWLGLEEPLILFPESSLCYAQKLRKYQREKKRHAHFKAFKSAESIWNRRFRPESDSPVYRLLWGEACLDDLDQRPDHLFRRTATDLLLPLVDHLEAGP